MQRDTTASPLLLLELELELVTQSRIAWSVRSPEHPHRSGRVTPLPIRDASQYFVSTALNLPAASDEMSNSYAGNTIAGNAEPVPAQREVAALGDRRYSRYQLRIAARAHELVAAGTALDAACRIIILEDQLAEARRINTELQQSQQHATDLAPGT